MKRYLLLASVLLIGAFGFSQEKSKAVPAAAQAAFQKAYPGAAKVKWDKEKEDYEVNFTIGKKEMAAVYTAAGALKETEEEIAVSELPAGVTAYIKAHYSGATIKEAAKITKANGEVNYEAEVKKVDVIFDKDGKFLREQKD
ncbi:MAG: PepSY-like domain-containing protein [Filimonas sp.]|nr:PepSY-like domain-containing protein [Filimonas sp.]